MKQINQLLPKDQTQLTSWSPTKKEYKRQQPEVILRLFAAMLVKYGHKWSSYIGDDVDGQVEIENEWGRQLGKFNMQQIKNSLDIVVDNYPEWPPTIGEFKALCSIGDRSWETEKQLLALDNPSKPETVNTNISQMKEILS